MLFFVLTNVASAQARAPTPAVKQKTPSQRTGRTTGSITAAVRPAVAQQGIDRRQVFIVAQSIGTEHLATHFEEFAAIQPPVGVVLLSSLLGPDLIVAIAAPVHIIVSDSESNLDAISVQAAAAHQQQWPYGATYYIADHSEHTLFDISDAPIDWSDPAWVQRYHRGAMQSMINWMQNISKK